MDDNEIAKLVKAGKIAKETVEFASSFILPGMPLLEIAEKIENKIIELGGKPAFPVNLSMNELAAHSTPSLNDTFLAGGLLKVDIGIHLDGYVADTAISLDLENSPENKALISSAELALQKAIEKLSHGIKIREIGAEIEKTISSSGFSPIANLSGHSIERWTLHAGITIPNFDNSQDKQLIPGVYAIEPFSTTGTGSVKDGKSSGIYSLKQEGNVRDSLAREILAFIREEYKTLPFCSRWICKKFGSRALLSLQRLKESGILHNYPQLIEAKKGKVAQAEHTIIFQKDKIIVTTI